MLGSIPTAGQVSESFGTARIMAIGELEAELWVKGDNRRRMEAVKAEFIRRGRVFGPAA
jgi:hypothetical protein